MASTQAPAPPRVDSVLDLGLEYRPADPVRVRVVRRDHRISVSDRGGAIEKAGRPDGWKDVARRVEREHNVNVTRSGVVGLPVVPVGPSEEEVIRRVGEASLALYQELLELADRER